MEIAMTRMDDKFRILLPKRLRESSGIKESTNLLVYVLENALILKIPETKEETVQEDVEYLLEVGGVKYFKQ